MLTAISNSKKRGKRAAPTNDAESGSPSGKKAKAQDDETTLTAYQKEVKRLNASSLKDEGYDMRPLLK